MSRWKCAEDEAEPLPYDNNSARTIPYSMKTIELRRRAKDDLAAYIEPV